MLVLIHAITPNKASPPISQGDNFRPADACDLLPPVATVHPELSEEKGANSEALDGADAGERAALNTLEPAERSAALLNGSIVDAPG